mgnify:CR=1 FL=1
MRLEGSESLFTLQFDGVFPPIFGKIAGVISPARPLAKRSRTGRCCEDQLPQKNKLTKCPEFHTRRVARRYLSIVREQTVLNQHERMTLWDATTTTTTASMKMTTAPIK